MKSIALCLLAVGLFAGAPAWAGEGYCKARVTGDRDEQVQVSFTVRNGAITSREAKWRPALIEKTRGEGTPDLEINYWPVEEFGPAAPSSVIGSVVTLSAGREFADATATLALDDNPPLEVRLHTFGIASARRGGASFMTGTAQFSVQTPGFEPINPDVLGKAEDANQATITVLSKGKQPISVTKFELSRHELRDELFRKAWDEAGRQAADPAPCSNS